MMSHCKIRPLFCMALAVIAAAIADPLVEFVSNAGWFGRGSLTDHSNLDVVPALLAGLALLALHVAGKARAILAGRVFPRGIVRLLPAIFALQILTLYGMETGEQLVAWGHVLGHAVWLGAPLPISLAIHAATCIAVTLWVGRSARTLAATTLHVIRLIRAIAIFAVQAKEIVLSSRFDAIYLKELAPVLCRIGERAPPLLSAT
jgi:hypothetical protein